MGKAGNWVLSIKNLETYKIAEKQFKNKLLLFCFSPHTFSSRSVWRVRHRGGRAPLVQTQCLPALRHGHFHGAAGAAQHGDRVSKTQPMFRGCMSHSKHSCPSLIDKKVSGKIKCHVLTSATEKIKTTSSLITNNNSAVSLSPWTCVIRLQTSHCSCLQWRVKKGQANPEK